MSALEEPAGPARPDAGARARRAGQAVAAQIRALLVPDRGVPALVLPGRARLSFVIVLAAAALAAAALSARVDLAPAVRAESAQGPGGGPPGTGGEPMVEDKTDREIEEEIAKRTAIVQVQLWLEAALLTPARVVGLAIALLLLGRYVGGRPRFRGTLAAAAVGALPWAVRSIIEAAAVWRQQAVLPGDLDLVVAGILPSDAGPVTSRLLAGVDAFSLWSLVLCGFGLAAAAGISRLRSFVTVTVGFALFLLLSMGVA